ncbi:MAG: acetyltransferase [Phycisphaerae bacterium]|nr:acetyltransferase [Phycisphaerae bacterium]
MTSSTDRNTEAMAGTPPARRSAWTTRQKCIRLLWGTFGRAAWWIPALRVPTLRMFGGRVGRGCNLPRKVELTIPWNITLGDRVFIGERAILYSLGPITVGSDVVIEVRAHLCAGSHDMRDTRFPLTRPPITIGDRCHIGIDAYIAPDVELGEDCRVMHRASVYSSQPAGSTLAGNPAKPVEGGA